MNFSETNCRLFNKFYNYTLEKKYGIGKQSLTYKDYLFAYLNVNNSFLQSPVETTASTTTYIGVITQDNILLPPNIAYGYYINDQDAFDNGVSKNAIYFLAQNNTYGSPFGTPKKLVEDVE